MTRPWPGNRSRPRHVVGCGGACRPALCRVAWPRLMLGDLHTCGFFRLKYRSGSLTTSHAIPLWLVQTLNLHRWNCNVCGLSRKMTELNYVRNVDGGFLDGACRCRSQALRTIGLSPRRWVLPFEIPEWFPNNVARNSPVACSSVEFVSLELQRLWPVSKSDRVKLRARFGWGLSRWRVSAPQPGSPDRRVLRAPRRGSMEDAFCLIYRPFMASCQQAIFLGP